MADEATASRNDGICYSTCFRSCSYVFQVLLLALNCYTSPLSLHTITTTDFSIYTVKMPFIGAPIVLGRCPSLSAHKNESVLRTYPVCRERQKRERKRDKQTARGRSTQRTNNRDPITSTSESLLRQNNVTAHAHQSQARRLASDHCATEIHRPKSTVQSIRVPLPAARWGDRYTL
jgi:hypothetical protein